ncbi:MAG: hypothetical protein SVO96_08240 [Pseudomonadota bacterium]|nr:hypothetical protein [Pseudomonadota bacterium]
MDDIVKIVLASILTVVSGATVFVAGQLLDRALVIPIHDLKKIIGDIRFALVFYSREICMPIEEGALPHEEARGALGKLSCDILTKMEAIPLLFVRIQDVGWVRPSQKGCSGSVETTHGAFKLD